MFLFCRSLGGPSCPPHQSVGTLKMKMKPEAVGSREEEVCTWVPMLRSLRVSWMWENSEAGRSGQRQHSVIKDPIIFSLLVETESHYMSSWLAR